MQIIYYTTFIHQINVTSQRVYGMTTTRLFLKPKLIVAYY